MSSEYTVFEANSSSKNFPEKPQDCVRFVCIADTHNRISYMRHRVPHGDVLLVAGDFTMVGDLLSIERFNEDLNIFPHLHKVVIAGNHELSFDPTRPSVLMKRFKKTRNMARDLARRGMTSAKELLTNCTLLDDSSTTIHGIKIYGSSWIPTLTNWAYYCPDNLRIEKWNKIPEDCDILLTHSPPLGIRDRPMFGCSCGCLYLLQAVERVKPLFHVFGHLHDGHGIHKGVHTTFINASICDAKYVPCYPPVVFDFPLSQIRDKHE